MKIDRQRRDDRTRLAGWALRRVDSGVLALVRRRERRCGFVSGCGGGSGSGGFASPKKGILSLAERREAARSRG